jgi:iron-sulfur cluster repair protein YtfE (RIC family)
MEPDNVEHIGEKIAQALRVHTEMEEHVFYPAIEERAERERHKKDKWLVDHAFNEHHMVKEMLQELAAARGENSKMHAVLTKMHLAVKAHVMEEEKIMFPDVRKMFDKEELRRLAARMREIKAHRPAA